MATEGAHTIDASGERQQPFPASIGPYRIEALLGRGGMGEVYRAFDPRLQRHVALKRILPGRHGARARARFWREARALAALSHPDLVQIHDIGEDGGDLYLAMELVAGTPLSELAGAPWSPSGVASLGVLVARALGAAHTIGIVHRDIKPSNILLQPDGRPRVLDFGLARRSSDDDQITGSESMVGTINYMAPEQIGGQAITPAADVYALGTTLYGLLAGFAPHSRESQEATVAAIIGGVHRPIAELRPDAPAALTALIERCLAVDPARRPADGNTLADLLEGTAKALSRPLNAATLQTELGLVGQVPALPLVDTRRALDQSKPGSRRWLFAALAALVIAGGVSGVALGPCDAPREVMARQTVAVWPLVAERSDDARVQAEVGELGELVAAGVREYIGVADDVMAALSHWELERGAGRADIILRGEIDSDGAVARVTYRVYVPGRDDPLATLTAEGAQRDPLALCRDLVTELADAIDVPLPELPILTPSGDAWRALVLARDAQLLNHQKAFDKQVTRALEAQPGWPGALLIEAQRKLEFDDIAGAREVLEKVEEHAASIVPRDVSFARILSHGLDNKERRAWREAVDQHLRRWPYDVAARIELMHAKFMGVGDGVMAEAAEYAEELARNAAGIPLPISKLVRALAWTGRVDEVRPLLTRLGIDARTPNSAAIFGELALYERRYDEAIQLLKQDRGDEGRVPLYPLHLAIAAQMLRGDCADAALAARARIESVLVDRKPIWIDWTYYLWFHALVCDGQIANAWSALEEWHGRTGTERAPYTYLWHRWDLGMLDASMKERTLADAREAAQDENVPHRLAAMLILARFETEPPILRDAIKAMNDMMARTLGGSPTNATARLVRSLHALEARLALREGRVDEALRRYEALADLEGNEPINEGELFIRTRFKAMWAEALDATGRSAEAEKVWRQILDLGYDRLLAMDVTLAAKRRLGLAK